MTADAIKVRDEAFGLISAAVVAYDPTVKLYWQGVPANDQPTSNDIWLRVSLQHVTGRQSSLAGEDGVRRWNRTGFISVQCFAPLARGSVQAATKLACVVRDALQGKQTASCVWFRNPRINEVGEDKDWFNVNATIDFDYDELR
ncbi:structural protein [Stenotrophomonas phage vB_SmaS-AXL_3]|uniref:Structural protein n=1 Tax=Stenotrophomonas phage vB_SmaS-AXL_3 TaxID=2740427 RepID=A0A7D5BHA6_9CAUD|nr:tail terminator [Stenotrophomonas phage vB_SmaS-AXL_3]QKW95599.1 structural protein [Stenotrophomonas phage vB_SmaS-AXL_3]